MWNQERADSERWQPGLYAVGYWLVTGEVPGFEYVVLRRDTGAVERYPTRRTEDQLAETLEQAGQIVSRIQAQEFGCTCGEHGRSEPRPSPARRIRLGARGMASPLDEEALAWA